jgi:hypothetical protein
MIYDAIPGGDLRFEVPVPRDNTRFPWTACSIDFRLGTGTIEKGASIRRDPFHPVKEHSVLTKLHLKRDASDRFALCGVLPDHSFVLIDALSRQSGGAVCGTCIGIAFLARKDAGTAVQPTQTTSKPRRMVWSGPP